VRGASNNCAVSVTVAVVVVDVGPPAVVVVEPTGRVVVTGSVVITGSVGAVTVGSVGAVTVGRVSHEGGSGGGQVAAPAEDPPPTMLSTKAPAASSATTATVRVGFPPRPHKAFDRSLVLTAGLLS
jgi:hypothetical protein